MDNSREIGCKQFLLAISQHLTERLIHLQQGAVQANDSHTNRGFLENVAEAFLALSECPLCPLVLGNLIQDNQAAGNTQVTIAAVQGRDVQVEAAPGRTITQDDLCLCLGHVGVVLDQFRPGGEDLGERLSDCFRSCAVGKALRSQVEINDTVLLVQDNHGIIHAFEDGFACHRHNL